MQSTPSFDSLLVLTPVPSPSTDPSKSVFRIIAPKEMAFAGVGGAFTYGGYLTAVMAKAILQVVNGQGYPHILSLTVDVVSGVVGGDEVEILVDVVRSTRRLAFVRASLTPTKTPTRPSVLSQSLCGTIAPSKPSKAIGHHVSERFHLSKMLATTPSLKRPEDGVEDLVARVSGLPRQPDLNRRYRYVKVLHSKEAVAHSKAKVQAGVKAVRTENWETLDSMPYILAHRDDRPMDVLVSAL
ncbi:hypothetical protein HDU93_006660 [Gonapodya sp. JEL0774]|nr:hypothetical protein HDU93_006660 [Gonapodya sp. JEL0774]